MIHGKGRDTMFISKKIKKAVAATSAVIAILMNTVTSIAAPFTYGSADDIRAKALGEYLSSSGIILAGTDYHSSSKNETESITTKQVTETEKVSYNTIKRVSASLPAGYTNVIREGVEGEKSVTYKVKYQNGKEVSREMVSETLLNAPVDKIVEYGDTDAKASTASDDTSFSYKYVIECKATAYDLSPEENGGYAGQSATGVPLDKGVIAVDPRVIPLGSRVYIEALDGSWSYGYAVAADTGGAIKGKRVDLCYRTQKECIQFGVRPCRVYVLS